MALKPNQTTAMMTAKTKSFIGENIRASLPPGILAQRLIVSLDCRKYLSCPRSADRPAVTLVRFALVFGGPAAAT